MGPHGAKTTKKNLQSLLSDKTDSYKSCYFLEATEKMSGSFKIFVKSSGSYVLPPLTRPLFSSILKVYDSIPPFFMGNIPVHTAR